MEWEIYKPFLLNLAEPFIPHKNQCQNYLLNAIRNLYVC